MSQNDKNKKKQSDRSKHFQYGAGGYYGLGTQFGCPGCACGDVTTCTCGGCHYSGGETAGAGLSTAASSADAGTGGAGGASAGAGQ